MNIIFYLPVVGKGGAERHAARLAVGLRSLGHSVVVAVARGGGDYEASLREAGVEILDLACGHIRSSLFSVVAATLPLRRVLKSREFDVVMTFLPHTALVVWAASFCCRSKARFIAGIQNNYTAELASTRGLWWLVHFSFRFVAAKAAHVIALSQGVHDDLLKHKPGLRPRLSVISNAGYDASILIASESPCPLAKPPVPLLLACGRLTEQKDYPTLFGAVAKLRARGLAFELWILGDGELRERLQEAVSAMGAQDQIRFLGFQKNPFAYYRLADVFVLSSRWEGFGNVIVEAMALGLPVVSTDCPFGPAEILNGGEFGRLVPVGDGEALAEALHGLLADASAREAFSRKGRPRASIYEASLVTEEHAALFQKIIRS